MAFIQKRKTAGGQYRFDVRWLVDGEPRQRRFRLRKEAEAWKRKVEADELRGVIVDPRAGDERFDIYADWWLDTRLARGRPLSPMTVEGYRGLLKRNILPTFAQAPLRKITTDSVRSWHTRLVATAGPDAAAKAYRLLRSILNTAVADDRLGRNPCRITGAGTEHRAERPMLETSTVLDLADAIGPRFRALVLLAGFGGLRTGELLGLRRRDVDLLRAIVHVRVQAQQVIGQGRIVGGPKSEAGSRTVTLPKTTLAALEEHLGTFAQPGPDGVVFTAPQGGPLRRAELSRVWRASVAAVGAPAGLRIHDLRHHAATSMARMPGVTTKELMARIGHSSPRGALIYQHATEARDRAIAEFLEVQITSAERTSLAPVQRIGGAPDEAPRNRAWDVRGMEQVSTNLGPTKTALTCPFTPRRRPESNRCTGLCRPLPQPLGHAATNAAGRSSAQMVASR